MAEAYYKWLLVARPARDHFRCAEPPAANTGKYSDELLYTCLLIGNADALYAEYAAQSVEFARLLASIPWHRREFVV